MELAEYDLMYRIESNYWWYMGRRWLVTKLLGHWLGTPRSLDILDVGCGTGANLQDLERFGSGTGCDISQEAVNYCHSRGLDQVVLQPGPTTLPFPDARFDVVTCLDVIEHIEDDVAMLREVTRVLKPGGSALFTAPASPALWSVHDESLHHKRRYRRAELLEKMELSGLAPRKTTYLNALLLPLIVPVRWLRDRMTRRKAVTSDFHLSLPGWLNAAFLAAFKSEWAILRFVPLPAGLSLCVIAQKKPDV